jgi:hypothetical protein
MRAERGENRGSRPVFSVHFGVILPPGKKLLKRSAALGILRHNCLPHAGLRQKQISPATRVSLFGRKFVEIFAPLRAYSIIEALC